MRVASTKSPRREPGDSGSNAIPRAMRCGFEPGHCVPSSGMDGGVVFTPGVPGLPPGASWNARRFHKKPPAGAGGLRVECDPTCHALPVCTGDSHPVIRHGRRGGFHTRSPRVTTRGFLERASLPQKAPGGSRGTPGRMRSRVPCDVGLNRDIACRHPAWTAGWFSHPVSPGSRPGLLGPRTARGWFVMGEGGAHAPGAGLWEQAQPGWRSAADMQ
jgi:hypothetical protein